MREEGYYWVRMRPFGKWHIAEWYNGYWITSWSQNKYLDPYFEEIDEKRLTHE